MKKCVPESYVFNPAQNTFALLIAKSFEAGDVVFSVRGTVADGFGYKGTTAAVVTMAP